MAVIPRLDQAVIESMSKVLADTAAGFTGSELGQLLLESNILDVDSKNTKWRRLRAALTHQQNHDKCANRVILFVQNCLNPAKHYDNQEWFNDTLFKLNKILSFSGLVVGDDGKVTKTSRTKTISEAAARASKLKESLISRKVHADVLKYCREELVVENYFHSVFEATKSVADKIRNRTGLTTDGALLVDQAFSFNNNVPYLALNKLETESEKNEQKGFMNLLKGLFGTFRNTTAHAPKITWSIEEIDALDILSLVSLVHRRLDNAVEAKKLYEGKI